MSERVDVGEDTGEDALEIRVQKRLYERLYEIYSMREYSLEYDIIC